MTDLHCTAHINTTLQNDYHPIKKIKWSPKFPMKRGFIGTSL